MKTRGLRWLLFIVAAILLLKSVFGTASAWSVGGFFLCGVLWYWLTWRKTRELDAPRPR